MYPFQFRQGAEFVEMSPSRRVFLQLKGNSTVIIFFYRFGIRGFFTINGH